MDENILKILSEIGVGVRSIHDPFFNESYRVCKVFQKTGVTVENDEILYHPVIKEFPCNAPGCQATFQSLLDFEVHYNSTHRYTCSKCKKIKSNSRHLEIHIQEKHDNFFKILAEKQPMYQCYVSDCDMKFENATIRREHCVTVHKISSHFIYDDASVRQVEKKVNPEDLMEIDQLTKNLSISKKTKPNLNKNQKYKTFESHMKNTGGVSSAKENESSIVPLSSKSIASSSSSSSLMFIPRQLTHKSPPKALTRSKSVPKIQYNNESTMNITDTPLNRL